MHTSLQKVFAIPFFIQHLSEESLTGLPVPLLKSSWALLSHQHRNHCSGPLPFISTTCLSARAKLRYIRATKWAAESHHKNTGKTWPFENKCPASTWGYALSGSCSWQSWAACSVKGRVSQAIATESSKWKRSEKECRHEEEKNRGR